MEDTNVIVEDLLKELNRQNVIIDKLQEENVYRMNVQYSREDELKLLIKENNILKSKLYWWQK